MRSIQGRWFSVPVAVLAVVMGFSNRAQAASTNGEIRFFVAPFDGESTVGVRPIRAALPDLLAIALAQDGRFVVLDRFEMEKVAREKELSLGGSLTPLQAGALVRADLVLVGRLATSGSVTRLQMDAWEVATSRLVARWEQTVSAERLTEAAAEGAKQAAERIAGATTAVRTQATDMTPDARLHFAEGVVRLCLNDLEAAVVCFMKTSDADPDQVEPHRWAGRCYEQMDRPAHAAIEYEEVLRMSPADSRAGSLAVAVKELRKKVADDETRLKKEFEQRERVRVDAERKENAKRKAESDAQNQRRYERRVKGIEGMGL